MKSFQCLSNNPCSGELRKWGWTEESVGWQRECSNEPSSQAWSRAAAQTRSIPAFLLGNMGAVQSPSQGGCEVKRDRAWEPATPAQLIPSSSQPLSLPQPYPDSKPENEIRQQKQTLATRHLSSFHSLHFDSLSCEWFYCPTSWNPLLKTVDILLISVAPENGQGCNFKYLVVQSLVYYNEVTEPTLNHVRMYAHKIVCMYIYVLLEHAYVSIYEDI